jgi:hypothetical protein
VSDSVWHGVTLALLGGFALLALCVVALMRQVGGLLILIQPHVPKDIGGGPEIGSIEDFPGLSEGAGALVVFVAPDCQPCRELAPSFPAFRRAWPDTALHVVVARGTDDERREYARSLGEPARADLRQLYERWEVRGTPFGVAIDGERRVRAKGVINTFDQMEQLALGTIHQSLDHEDNHVDEEPVPARTRL